MRRAKSASAAVSCLGGVRKVVEERGDVVVEAGFACVRARVLARVLARRSAGRWGRARLLAAGGDAGGRRGCQSHVNLQFSCSFFLQGKGTPNGRLRERAGRLDVRDVAWGSAGLAMIGDGDHRWSLPGDCCPASGSWERQLQAGGGGSRSFGGVAEILSSAGVAGVARQRAPGGARCGSATGGRVVVRGFPNVTEVQF